jgi:uncharacterized Fe-S cluster-containing radical SAM superfamily protein
MRKLFDSKEFMNSLVKDNTLFRFDKRPKLNGQGEETIFYEEMFAVLDKFNKTIDLETGKMLMGQLKTSIAELSEKEDAYSRLLLKQIKEQSLEKETSLDSNLLTANMSPIMDKGSFKLGMKHF